MTEHSKITEFNHQPQIAGMLPGDHNIEFIGIRKTQQVTWLQNGTNHYFTDLPIGYFNLLKTKYLKDHKAVRFLSECTEDIARQVELYTYFLYGEVDATPDIENGKLSESENFRDTANCPSLKWLSKNINIGSIILTPRQLVIADLMSQGLPDKAIADALGIAHKTLDNHKQVLYRRLQVQSKSELLRLLYQHKIVA